VRNPYCRGPGGSTTIAFPRRTRTTFTTVKGGATSRWWVVDHLRTPIRWAIARTDNPTAPRCRVLPRVQRAECQIADVPLFGERPIPPQASPSPGPKAPSPQVPTGHGKMINFLFSNCGAGPHLRQSEKKNLPPNRRPRPLLALRGFIGHCSIVPFSRRMKLLFSRHAVNSPPFPHTSAAWPSIHGGAFHQ